MEAPYFFQVDRLALVDLQSCLTQQKAEPVLRFSSPPGVLVYRPGTVLLWWQGQPFRQVPS